MMLGLCIGAKATIIHFDLSSAINRICLHFVHNFYSSLYVTTFASNKYLYKNICGLSDTVDFSCKDLPAFVITVDGTDHGLLIQNAVGYKV